MKQVKAVKPVKQVKPVKPVKQVKQMKPLGFLPRSPVGRFTKTRALVIWPNAQLRAQPATTAQGASGLDRQFK